MADIPDIYADSFRITSNIWGITLSFGTRSIDEPESDEQVPTEAKALIRMGHLHAKVVAMLMRRVLQQYEERSGEPIRVPEHLAVALELQEADW